MRWLALFVLLTGVFAFSIDGTCNRTGGESCMNSPDCSMCDITMDVNVTYAGTYALVMVDMKNNEPAEIPLILSIRGEDEDYRSKAVDIGEFESKGIDVRVERKPENFTLIVEARDRDIGTVWSFHKQTLPGLQSEGESSILLPLVGVVLFLTILFLGFKQARKAPGPYVMQPVFAPVYPSEPQPKEEIIIVPKKKKYYYKKN